MKRAARSLLVGTLILVSVMATDAGANNTHPISGVYHGCGECSTTNDFYIHAFTDYPNTSFKRAAIWLDGTLQYSATCNCSHAHRSWDTNPFAECHYTTNHYSASPALNSHYHYAHGTTFGC